MAVAMALCEVGFLYLRASQGEGEFPIPSTNPEPPEHWPLAAHPDPGGQGVNPAPILTPSGAPGQPSTFPVPQLISEDNNSLTPCRVAMRIT